MKHPRLLAGFALSVGVYATAAVAQYADSYVQSRDHPAIEYSKGPVTDRVSAVNRKLQDGALQLKFDGPGGYLRSALDALNIPVESQVAVFAQNSSLTLRPVLDAQAVPYETLRDLVPLGLSSRTPSVLEVSDRSTLSSGVGSLVVTCLTSLLRSLSAKAGRIASSSYSVRPSE